MEVERKEEPSAAVMKGLSAGLSTDKEAASVIPEFSPNSLAAS
ncbi:hypothetical protein [Bacillus sp. AFS031507]|nr:hypothetical protein [Bacillus sp. AFS031507]